MTAPETLRLEVKKAALLNAIKHEGKADPNAVMGRLLGTHVNLRQRIANLRSVVSDVVNEVNRTSFADQKKIVEENWPEELTKEKAKTERTLPPLPNADNYAVITTRISPNPDSVLHLGNARAAILSHDYARMYDGNFILRFEDTDPRLKKACLQYYDLIRADLEWLECPWNEEYLQSDRLEIYYEHAEELINKGGAYVCQCRPEDFKRLTEASHECPCRSSVVKENLARWRGMLDGTYDEGEAVVRVKTDLNHPNPAVRDWPALRVIDTVQYPHPRVGSKYRVWPLYNLACGVDDHLMGISHVIRGKEHLTNMERQKYLYKHLGWQYPEAIHYGRLHLTGVELSKSKMMQSLEEGLYKDLSDPRLGTLMALRRRGICPKALRSIIYEVGPRPVDATISWENIYATNRKIIDPEAPRFFFVDDPLPLSVSGLTQSRSGSIPFHPNNTKMGSRQLTAEVQEGECHLVVSKRDLEMLKPETVVRLMELFNLKIKQASLEGVTGEFHSESYAEAKKSNAPLIQWLPEKGNCRASVMMPIAETIEGLGEPALLSCHVDEVVQLVRFGFARIDAVTRNSVAFYFAHQ